MFLRGRKGGHKVSQKHSEMLRNHKSSSDIWRGLATDCELRFKIRMLHQLSDDDSLLVDPHKVKFTTMATG